MYKSGKNLFSVCGYNAALMMYYLSVWDFFYYIKYFLCVGI